MFEQQTSPAAVPPTPVETTEPPALAADLADWFAQWDGWTVSNPRRTPGGAVFLGLFTDPVTDRTDRPVRVTVEYAD